MVTAYGMNIGQSLDARACWMGFLIADSNEERWIFQLPTSYHIWILDSL